MSTTDGRSVTRLLGSLACHVLGWCRSWLEHADDQHDIDDQEPDDA